MAIASKGLPRYAERFDAFLKKQSEAYKKYGEISKLMSEGNQAAAIELAEAVAKMNGEIRKDILTLLGEVQKSVTDASRALSEQTSEAIFTTAVSVSVRLPGSAGRSLCGDPVHHHVAAVRAESGNMNALANGRLRDGRAGRKP